MQRYTVYLYLKTAVHVSGAFSTYHQENTPAAIVEEFQLFHDRGQVAVTV